MSLDAPETPRDRLARRVSAIPLATVERLAVCLLLVAALVPRARDLGAPFDRGVEGEQGAFFAVAAVNYARGESAGLYPALNLAPPASDAQRFVYANHPPTVPLVAYASARALGPAGWTDAHRGGAPPEGVELALRVPSFVASAFALAWLWLLARRYHGARVALLALGLGAASSAGIQLAGLVNYEPFAVAAGLVLVGCGLRYAEDGERRALAWSAGAAALCASITYAPLAFLPPLAVAVLRRRGARGAIAFAACAGVGAAAPLVLHHFASRAALDGTLTPVASSVFERAREIFAPLADGSVGLGAWCAAQVDLATRAHGLPIVALFAAAALWRAARSLRGAARRGVEREDSDTRRAPFFGVLAWGAPLALFLSYRHTAEEQWNFQLWWWPAFALGAALALDRLADPLAKLRAGWNPLVLLALGVALPGLGAQAAWRARTRGDASPIPPPIEIGRFLRASTAPDAVVAADARLGVNLAASYYAWRLLRPATGPDDPAPAAVASALGVDGARRWLAPAAGALADEVAPLPHRLASVTPLAADAAWRLYALDPSAPEDLEQVPR